MKRLMMSDYLYAMEIAKQYHGETKRRGSEELFVQHPIRVSDMLYNYTHDLTLAIAGLCHDLLEDTDYTEQQMLDDFGAEVCSLVKSVTYDKESGIPKNEFIVMTILESPFEVELLKLCDRYDNICSLDLKDPDPKRFNSFRKKCIRDTEEILKDLSFVETTLDIRSKDVIAKIEDKIKHLKLKYNIGDEV